MTTSACKYENDRIVKAKRKSDPNLCAAFQRVIENRQNIPIRKVLAYEESIKNRGYCETCDYSYVAVTVWYKDQGGKMRQTVFEESLTSLVNMLSKS